MTGKRDLLELLLAISLWSWERNRLLLDGVDARVLAVAREDDPLVRSRAPLDDVVVHRAGGLRVAGVEALVEGIRVMASKVDH